MVVRPLFALFLAVGVVPTHLGSGDDVVPRNTESIIESVSPALPPGVMVDIVGGDTFVRVRSRGHEVEIRGYENEPYAMIRPNGDVLENINSTTWILNRSRYGTNVPPEPTVDDATNADPADSAGAGNWRTIASSGSFMWHDHRIHWMSPSTPPTIDDKGTVQNWTVPIVVDGATHTVKGTLYLRDRASVLWWFVIAVAAAVAAVLARGARTRWYAAITWVSALSCFVGFLEWRDLPSGAQITPLMLLFGIGALIVANTATALHKSAGKNPKKRAKNEWIASSLAAGAGVTLVISGWMNTDQVRAAYIPFMGPLWVARVTVLSMIGVGLVATIDGVIRVMRVEPMQPGDATSVS